MENGRKEIVENLYEKKISFRNRVYAKFSIAKILKCISRTITRYLTEVLYDDLNE